MNQSLFRRFFGLSYFAFFITFFLFRIASGLSLTQLEEPFLFINGDAGVWLFHKLGFIHHLVEQPYALIFDLLILCSAITCFYLFYSNKKTTTAAIIFSLLAYLYFITIFSTPTLSSRRYFGLLLIPFTFWFTDQRFKNYTELIRYFVLFIFSSAALWKISRGVFSVNNQMVHLLQNQYIESFYLLPENHIQHPIARYLIQHPSWANILLSLGIVLQLSFGVGFFTKKFDRILFTLLLIFIISDWLIMGIEYWEFLVFTPYFFIPQIKKNTDYV